MVEVCWGPMLAAFSVTLDQSDDKAATSQSLQGIRHAVHVTAVMGMQTQRDAFVTTIAKFTYLHCAADIKQKNVDAVKVISLQTLFYMCPKVFFFILFLIFFYLPQIICLCVLQVLRILWQYLKALDRFLVEVW